MIGYLVLDPHRCAFTKVGAHSLHGTIHRAPRGTLFSSSVLSFELNTGVKENAMSDSQGKLKTDGFYENYRPNSQGIKKGS
ncbi:hypothetical protein GOP47_0028349 [Adiantum capillus-veneris]|nr:hypothetical protein GOP47_0028349 [Adiantum capillus-veneris]